jgi:hypothetical protein
MRFVRLMWKIGYSADVAGVNATFSRTQPAREMLSQVQHAQA